MNDEVQISDKALKTLKHMDKHQAKIIIGWINKNLSGCVDPRIQGKALVGDKKGFPIFKYEPVGMVIIMDFKAIEPFTFDASIEKIQCWHYPMEKPF